MLERPDRIEEELKELLVHAQLLFGNGEARTTRQLEEDMSAPDHELLLESYDILLKQYRDMLASAVNLGFGGK